MGSAVTGARSQSSLLDTKKRSPQLKALAQTLVQQPQSLNQVKDMIRHMLAQKMASRTQHRRRTCDAVVFPSSCLQLGCEEKQ